MPWPMLEIWGSQSGYKNCLGGIGGGVGENHVRQWFGELGSTDCFVFNMFVNLFILKRKKSCQRKTFPFIYHDSKPMASI
jgi:hypothetical protein